MKNNRILKLLQLVKQILTVYLVNRGDMKFSGKIIITVNCKDGGIGTTEVSAQENFKESFLDKIN